MSMTAEDYASLQEKILRLCNAAGKFGLPEARLLRALAALFPEIQTAAEMREDKSAELERQLRYLKSKGWIAEKEKGLRPDLRAWETTAAGDEYLMEKGFI
jgi:hypothetical protein